MEEIKDKNFFKKIWTSIVDFESYEEYAAENISRAIKYIFLFTLLFVIIVSLVYTYKFYLVIEDIKSYVDNNTQNISLIDGKLNVEADSTLIIENEDNIVPIIIVDTSDEAVEDEYLDKIKAYSTGAVVLSDKIIVSSNLLQIRRRRDIL